MDKKYRFYKDAFLIALANFIWPLGYSSYINFFPIHIRQLGGNDFVVSLIISIPLFAGILCIIGGILADYMDRKKLCCLVGLLPYLLRWYGLMLTDGNGFWRER